MATRPEQTSVFYQVVEIYDVYHPFDKETIEVRHDYAPVKSIEAAERIIGECAWGKNHLSKIYSSVIRKEAYVIKIESNIIAKY